MEGRSGEVRLRHFGYDVIWKRSADTRRAQDRPLTSREEEGEAWGQDWLISSMGP